MNPSILTEKQKIITPILFGVTLLIAIVGLRPLYQEYIEKNASVSTLTKEYQELEVELQSLESIKNNDISKLSPERVERIKKLAKPYNTSDIMAIVMLSDFTKTNWLEPAPITISSISVDKWAKLPNGLSLANVGISFQWVSMPKIIEYITALTQTAPYIFTLDSISLPIDTDPDTVQAGGYSMSISLGVYYYE